MIIFATIVGFCWIRQISKSGIFEIFITCATIIRFKKIVLFCLVRVGYLIYLNKDVISVAN